MKIEMLLDLADQFHKEYVALVDKYVEKVHAENDCETLMCLISEKSNPYLEGDKN